MPSRKESTISIQMTAAYRAINYTIMISDIQTLVARYGYTADKMQEGKQLYDVAVAAIATRTSALREQGYATERAQKAKKAAQASYQVIAQIARAVFGPGSAEYRALGLVGGMPSSTTGFMKAAVTLFDNALTQPEVAAGLARYGFTATRLESERASISAFAQAQENQVAAVKAARKATPVQQEAVAAVHQWVVQYLVIARIALADKPWMIKELEGRRRKAKPRAASAKR